MIPALIGLRAAIDQAIERLEVLEPEVPSPARAVMSF
jgi:hypothetical protein